MVDIVNKKEELELEELRKLERYLKDKIAENRAYQHEIMISLYTKRTGVQVGSYVESKNGKTGFVESFYVKHGLVIPETRIFKKDGALGKRFLPWRDVADGIKIISKGKS